MAVTTAPYSVSANYTPAQFATQVRSMFIDAGLMTDWFASFANGGVENRVLEITYDGSKTYGKTYYWFQFSGADMFVHICTGWNTSSNIPQGVGGVGLQYLDWMSTTTSETTNHMRVTASGVAGFNSSQSVSMQRITSNVRSNFSVFLLVNGSTPLHLIIDRTAPIASLVDLDKVCYTSMMWCKLSTSNRIGQASFQLFSPRLRRSHLGQALRGIISSGAYGALNTALWPWEIWFGAANQLGNITYGAIGNRNSMYDGDNYAFTVPVFTLPIAFTNTNPAYPADERPVLENYLFNLYSAATLPEDFAIIAIYNNNTVALGSTLQITPGVEEYIVIAVANASTSVPLGEAPTMVFGARTI
jgi:hypothetical protein